MPFPASPHTRGWTVVEHLQQNVRYGLHTRGWTLRAPRHDGEQLGFPAHAGMDPGRHGS